MSNVSGGSVFLLQHIPASIFGSIISIADIASNKPNISLCMSSPSESSRERIDFSKTSDERDEIFLGLPWTASKNSSVMTFHSYRGISGCLDSSLL